MQLVKMNNSIVQVIRREQDHFTVLTREQEVKKISAAHIQAVNNVDIIKSLKEIRTYKVINLSEYRKIRNTTFS